MELLKEDPDIVSLKISLIKLKSFSIIALKHLETVESEDLPNDAEFIELLWFCLNGIEIEGDDLRHMTSRVVLPGVDAPR